MRRAWLDLTIGTSGGIVFGVVRPHRGRLLVLIGPLYVSIGRVR